MAFGNISTFYFPIAANAGTSMWGTDVRKLLSSADGTSDATTQTQHGTDGGNTTRTFDPYTLSSTDTTDSLFGWAVDPSDMNSVSGARRFFPAGNHIATVQMIHDGLAAYSGIFYMYVYRVGTAGSGRARTLLGSASNTVSVPALAAAWTSTVTVNLAEVILEADETIQYSFEFNINNIFLTGHLITFYTGTTTGVASRIDTPGLKTLADTTGSSSGSASVSGSGAKVLGTSGSSSGVATVTGSLSARADTTGSSSGSASVSGSMSSVAGTTGESTGIATATAIATGIGSMIGSSEGIASVAGNLGAIGGMTGSSAGSSTVEGSLGATGGMIGSSASTATVEGQMSSLAGTIGTAAGVATVDGQTSIVLGTVGTSEVGGGGGETIYIRQTLFLDAD